MIIKVNMSMIKKTNVVINRNVQKILTKVNTKTKTKKIAILIKVEAKTSNDLIIFRERYEFSPSKKFYFRIIKQNHKFIIEQVIESFIKLENDQE